MHHHRASTLNRLKCLFKQKFFHTVASLFYVSGDYFWTNIKQTNRKTRKRKKRTKRVKSQRLIDMFERISAKKTSLIYYESRAPKNRHKNKCRRKKNVKWLMCHRQPMKSNSIFNVTDITRWFYVFRSALLISTKKKKNFLDFGFFFLALRRKNQKLLKQHE